MDKGIALEEIKKNKKEAIFGTRETIKELKKGNLLKIFISKDCPEKIKKELEKRKEKEIEIIYIPLNKEEINEIVENDFLSCVISIKKSKKEKTKEEKREKGKKKEGVKKKEKKKKKREEKRNKEKENE